MREERVDQEEAMDEKKEGQRDLKYTHKKCV